MGTNEFKSFFTKGDRKVNTWCRWPGRLDTYGCGCQHNCSYCYARSLLAFRGLWNAQSPAVARVPKIIHELDKEVKRGDVVRIGGMTDCFMPLEEKTSATYMALQMLNKRGIHSLIVTKSDLVASDRYLAVLDKELAHIQITITTTDDEISKRIEPGAPLPARRIAAVEKLQAEGYDVQVRLSPFIPEYVDIDRINAIKCDKILIEFLKVSPWIQKWLDIDYSPYTLSRGGYLNLPLERKIELVDKITGFKERSVGEFVEEHHAYFREHVNANPDDCCNLKL